MLEKNLDILIMTGPLAPPGNNASLLAKLFPALRLNNRLLLLSQRSDNADGVGKDSFFGVPVTWTDEENPRRLRRSIRAVMGKLVDPKGFSDYVGSCQLSGTCRRLKEDRPFDAIISTYEPFTCADAASRMKGVKRVLYLADPPSITIGSATSRYRERRLRKVFSAQTMILTTPFIRQALFDRGFAQYRDKLISVGFPMIERHDIPGQRPDDGRIHLLFCGWLYSEIRSPQYFLNILSRLDERFTVTFMGRECEKLAERFDVQTKAELITLPQQPYETALQAMADADILINIGNSVPVHMPSKTLEYINTGKPFVNFYKRDDCPTLYYTKRYPLCLNMPEGGLDLETAAAQFGTFCIQNKGKTVDRVYIETEYVDCTPEFIAQKILDVLGESK